MRCLEPVYYFSATLLQRNSLKYDERGVEVRISCLTHLEVALLNIRLISAQIYAHPFSYNERTLDCAKTLDLLRTLKTRYLNFII